MFFFTLYRLWHELRKTQQCIAASDAALTLILLFEPLGSFQLVKLAVTFLIGQLECQLSLPIKRQEAR